MTATPALALHDLPELVVGELVFKVAPPRQGKTIEIIVERGRVASYKGSTSRDDRTSCELRCC